MEKKEEGKTKRPRGRPKKTSGEDEQAAAMKKYLDKGNEQLAFGKGSKIVHSPKMRKEDSIVDKAGDTDEEEATGTRDTQERELVVEQINGEKDNEKEQLTGGRAKGRQNLTELEKGEKKRATCEIEGTSCEIAKKWKKIAGELREDRDYMIKVINNMREELTKARVERKELKAELEQVRKAVKANSERICEAGEDEFEYRLKAGEESQSIRARIKEMEREVEDLKNNNKSENEKDDTENGEEREEISQDDEVGRNEVSSGTKRSGGENVIETRKYLQDMPDKMGGQEYEREMLERRKRKKNIFVRGIRTVGRGIKEELTISNIIKEWIGVPTYSRKIRDIGVD